MNRVIISAVARTPFGSLQGSLASLKASELGAVAIKEALTKVGLSGDAVNSVLMGCVLPAGMGQAPARQAAIYAGLPNTVPTVTLNKMCGSGLETIIQASRMLALGEAEVVVAGGMESMTNSPYLLPKARQGYRMGNGEIIDSMVTDGLWDVYDNKHMGSCAEICATKYSFSREAQDDFAIRSYERAIAASERGFFKDEIVPVEVKGRKETVVVDKDEEPERVRFDKVRGLRTVFKSDGTVTAANASTINDGAVALILCTEDFAQANGLPMLASVDAYAANAHEPEMFTTAPVGAMQKVYDKLGAKPQDIDLYEINEAFSVVPMAAMEEFGLNAEQVNVNGGAVAIGHPIGASGARIAATLINALREQGKSKGMASICIGGGEALALAVTALG